MFSNFLTHRTPPGAKLHLIASFNIINLKIFIIFNLFWK